MAGRNSGGSGNNRFDNVTVEADTVNPILGINPLIATAPVYNLFPNPAKSTINVSGNTTGEKSIIITNVVGQVIISEIQNGRNFSINTSLLQSGIYYMTIRENGTGEITTTKFIKE